MAASSWGMVLLGEDDENDVNSTRRTLQKCGISGEIMALDNVMDIRCYLTGRGHYADRACFPLPRVVFLDVYLGYRPTDDLLRHMRSNPRLQHIPIILLTGALDRPLMTEFQNLGALRCLEKPLTPDHCADLKKLLPDIFIPQT